jgi:hypothetical protein
MSTASEIARIPYADLRWGSATRVAVIEKCPWPRVAVKGDDSGAEAGPTGLPWVDSNGWLVDVARACLPGAEIRLELEMPKSTPPPAGWAVAVADCEASGARCLVPQAAAPKEFDAANRFFASQPNRSQYAPAATIGVVSDFLPPNLDLAGEILNLSIRRTAQIRAIAKAGLAPADLRGLRLVICADQAPPAPALREHLLAFAKSGGIVMATSTWGKADGAAIPEDPSLDYEVRTLGKGRIAVARTPQEDSWRISVDAQTLLSRRYDLVRLWNAMSMNCRVWRTADGTRGLARIINYAMRPAAHPVTLSVSEPWRAATFQELGSSAPAPLELHRVAGGAELHLPAFAVFAQVELTK